MRKNYRNAFLLIGFSFASLLANPAKAVVTITASEVAGNVVLSGTGTLNITGLNYIGASGYTYGIDPSSSTFFLGPSPSNSDDFYTGITTPSGMGTGPLTNSSNGNGDSFGIINYGGTPTMLVPGGYAGGTLTGSATFTGQTFSTLGLNQGDYTWTWGSGATADSITMNVGTTPVPGPLPILGIPAVLLYSRNLKKRIKARRETSEASLA